MTWATHSMEGGLQPARGFSAASEQSRFSLASAQRESSPAGTEVHPLETFSTERIDPSGTRIPRPSSLFIAAALAISAMFWLLPMALTPKMTLDTLVLFRPEGDPGYFPQVAAAADLKLGEISVKEYAGTGVRSFPLAPFILHGPLERLLGPAGFMLADILVIFLYACALRYFLTTAGAGAWPAEFLSLLVISNTAGEAASKFGGSLHLPMPVKFWEERFPRPFITELFVVLFLILAVLLAANPGRPKRIYALFGAALAVLFQSDIYWAFTAAVVLGAVCLAALLRTSFLAMTARLAVMGIAFTVTSGPFVYQQLHASADVKRRLGVFFTSRYWQLVPDTPVIVCALAVLAVAGWLALRFRARARVKQDAKQRLPALAVLSVAVGASLITGPLSAALLRQVIQQFHFMVTAERAIGYMALLYAAWLLTGISRSEPVRRFPKIRGKDTWGKDTWGKDTLGRLVAGAAILAVALFISIDVHFHIRSLDRGTPSLPLIVRTYQADFPDLRRVLERPLALQRRLQPLVLGTFDDALGDWWQYRRRYLYLPDLFNSTVEDTVVESRILHFLRRVGTTPEDFGHLLNDEYFIRVALGGGKYQVNSIFTPWPLSEYSAGTKARLTTVPDYNGFEVPQSEKLRLIKAFEEIQGDDGSAGELDVIVFAKDHLRPYVHPERAGNVLLWSNRTFEVWQPAGAGP
jgi:hypothetical protein